MKKVNKDWFYSMWVLRSCNSENALTATVFDPCHAMQDSCRMVDHIPTQQPTHHVGEGVSNRRYHVPAVVMTKASLLVHGEL